MPGVHCIHLSGMKMVPASSGRMISPMEPPPAAGSSLGKTITSTLVSYWIIITITMNNNNSQGPCFTR
jgi:hypothetical protein